MSSNPIKVLTNLTTYHTPSDLFDIFIDLHKTKSQGLGNLNTNFIIDPFSRQRSIELVFARAGQSPVLIASKKMTPTQYDNSVDVQRNKGKIFNSLISPCARIEKTDWIGAAGIDFWTPFYLVTFRMDALEDTVADMVGKDINIWNNGGKIECFTLSPYSEVIHSGDPIGLSIDGTIQKGLPLNGIPYRVVGTAMHDVREGELLSLHLIDVKGVECRRARTNNEIPPSTPKWDTIDEPIKPKKPRGMVIHSIDSIRDKLRRSA